MKLLTSGRVLFALLFVVVFAVLMVTATGYNPTARVMPLLVAIPVFFAAIANFIAEVRAVRRGEKGPEEKTRAPVPAAVATAKAPAAAPAPALEVAAAGSAARPPATTVSPTVLPAQIPPGPVPVPRPGKKKEKLSSSEKRKRELIGIAWLIGYVVALVLLGFNLATLGYMLAFIKSYSRESWKLTIIYGAVLWLFVYVAFVVLLKSTLPPGMVFDWLQR